MHLKERSNEPHNSEETFDLPIAISYWKIVWDIQINISLARLKRKICAFLLRVPTSERSTSSNAYILPCKIKFNWKYVNIFMTVRMKNYLPSSTSDLHDSFSHYPLLAQRSMKLSSFIACSMESREKSFYWKFTCSEGWLTMKFKGYCDAMTS